MERKIIVYGQGDKSASGFETPEALTKYLEGGIFHDEDGRYRYTQTKGPRKNKMTVRSHILTH